MVKNPYMKARDKKLEKEIEETKKYIKKVWGKDIKLKEMSCKEMRELGDELEMNVFHRKYFKPQYSYGQKHLKFYTRTCRKCKKYYKAKRDEKQGRPKGSGVCLSCREKSHKQAMKKIKIKNKIFWEQQILNVLRKSKYGLTVREITIKLKCSHYPIYKTLKDLLKYKKVHHFKKVIDKISFNYYSAVTPKDL